ncbi:MAG: ABC transporter transmembrane domain-containing protein [Terasakiella sp.]|uniref:ABC transporter transmembrane domain-containing protein n=1 Tax=unclassified Terasakiella TaxID=2614952 RepID=UPI003AFFB01C
MASSPRLMDRPKSKNFYVLIRLFSFLAPYKPRVLLAFVALITTVGATLGLGQGLKQLIDAGFTAQNPQALDNALVFLLILAVVMAAGTFLRFFMVSWIGERVVADIRQAVFQRILSLHSAFFEVTRTGEILSRLTTDTTLLQSVIGSSASMALRNFLNLLGGVAMLFITNAKLTAIVLLVVPLVVAPIVIYGRKVRTLSKESQDRVADVGAFAEETINAIHTVQAFTHEREDERRFLGEVSGAFQAAVKRIQARSILSASVILLVFGAIAVVMWIGGRDVMNGAITGGELAAFLFYATMVAFNVGIISEVMGELQRAAGATERLVELLDSESEIKAPLNPLVLPEKPAGHVRFDQVDFRYPSRPDELALKDISLDIAAGETVALVGPSGAGKTTMMQILLRFFDVERGSVSIDGVNIALADPEEVRKRMALVPQDPVIFSANAWENIRYGRPDATNEEVRKAADAAQATEFLEKLPDGFDSFLGEKGMRLSGGQRQRLSIARALLRDPSILLLDEATSALDAENERVVQAALERLMVGRTTLIIAHRLATVVNADRICVIDEGRIQAIGTHHQLMEVSELYNHLAKLQFSADVPQ